MAKLTLVPPTDAEEEIVAAARNGERPCDLERRFGKTRQQIRLILRRHGLEGKRGVKIRDARPKLPRAPVDVSAPRPVLARAAPSAVGQSFSQIIWALVAILIGIVLGGAGIVLNCQYWYAVGGSNHIVSMIFCAMGGAIDAVTIALPSWAAELRKKGNYGLFGLAIIMFVPVASISLIASAGFSGTNIGDTLQIRSDTKISKEKLGAILAQKEAERASIKVVEMPAVIEVLIQNERGRVPRDNLKSSNDCTDTTWSDKVCAVLKQLRIDKAKAERRIVLDTEIEQMTAKYNSMPSIGSKDAASERISQMTSIRQDIVVSYLINAMAVAPILSGLFFAIATALLR